MVKVRKERKRNICCGRMKNDHSMQCCNKEIENKKKEGNERYIL